MSASSLSALVTRLRNSGASDAMIVDVIDTFAARVDALREPVHARDEQAERRRAADRERKASRRIPQNSADAPPSSSPPSLPPLHPPITTPTSSPPRITRAARDVAGALAALASVLSVETARAVIEHRQSIRKPLSVFAAQKLADAFAETGDPNASAVMMIRNGWQGFDPSWVKSRGQPPPARKTGSQQLLEALHRSHERLERQT